MSLVSSFHLFNSWLRFCVPTRCKSIYWVFFVGGIVKARAGYMIERSRKGERRTQVRDGGDDLIAGDVWGVIANSEERDVR